MGSCTSWRKIGEVRTPSSNVLTANLKFILDYNEYVGQGIQRTHAWKAKISKSELDDIRKAFWRTRAKASLVWSALQQIVEADPETAIILLEGAGLQWEGGSLTTWIDDEGNVYNIPVYIINDPQSFFVDQAARVVRESTESSDTISLKIRIIYKEPEEISKEFSAWNTVKEIKDDFLAGAQDYSSVRLFSGGREMLDDEKL